MRLSCIVAGLVLSWSASAFAQLEATALQEPPVQKEVALNPQQIERVLQASKEYRAAVDRRLQESENLQEARRNEYKDAVARGEDVGPFVPQPYVNTTDIAETFVAKVEPILTKAQMKRLEEIEVQRKGLRIIVKPKYAARLNLDPELVPVIKQVFADQQEQSTRAFDEFRGKVQTRELPRGGPKVIGIQQKLTRQLAAIDQQAEADVLRLLTKRQRAKLEEMAGEPFPRPTAEKVKAQAK